MRQAIIVADLGFGDAGKGTMVDYLARQAPTSVVVRYNGGPQAAHNVQTPDGRHHTFSQMGSASFVSGVRTHLSRHMLVNPFNLTYELAHLRGLGITDAWQRLSVDADAMVITPWHSAVNRMRELARGDGRHGSCGQGVGEVQQDALDQPDLVLRMRDLCYPGPLQRKLTAIRDYKRAQAVVVGVDAQAAPREWAMFAEQQVASFTESYGRIACQANIVESDYLARLMAAEGQVILEGSQGVLLDEWFGFHPYTTWSTTTFEYALSLLVEAGYGAPITRLGVLRGYMVRHGPGPFPTEDACLTARLAEDHNTGNPWQRAFRSGYLDAVLGRYAVEVCGGVDQLAITCLDKMQGVGDWQVATGYELADGRVLDHLAVGHKDQLARQERLGRFVAQAQPVYQPVATPSGGGKLLDQDDAAAYLAMISEQLQVPVAYASCGPTAEHKRHLAW